MLAQILSTKLHIPVWRSAFVMRSRLFEQLKQGRNRKLTLVSAPAGFGKTMLVSAWISHCDCPVTWLSLDNEDTDPARFLTYMVAALQQIESRVGEGVLGALQSLQPPPLKALLTMLLNEIDMISQDFLLVLDDYHVLSNSPIDEALTFLLEYLPPRMHLVIITREDPLLPLARLRVERQLVELRAADLRFTLDEATGFLNQVMHLNLPAQDIDALQSRTEGWIAGLQLAAISMQGASDTADFIKSFTGSHRFVLDYLVEEVLQHQPEDIQHFLLCTSMLTRLCGSLCDAVLGNSDGAGQAALDYCERANLLLIPLDDKGGWYRYHHLFAEVLQTRLTKSQPEQVSMLHQRASVWYEQNQMLSDAIHHAFAAGNSDDAAALVERVWPAMRKSRQEAVFLRWVRALPDEIIRWRPVLSVVSAWALLDAGELDAAESRLQEAERWLDSPSPEMIVADQQQFGSLPASIANARAYRAQALNDISGTITYAQLALSLLPEADYYERGTTSALLGLAYWTSGNLTAAYRFFAEGLDNLQKGGGAVIRIGGTVILGHMMRAQGRLRDAVKLYEQTLQFATSQGDHTLKGTAQLYLGLSELLLEQGDLETARNYLLKGESLREQASLPGYEYLWSIVEARLQQADGNLSTAFDLLDEAQRHYYRSPIPDIRPIPALKARLFLAADRVSDALVWVNERDLSTDDNLSYLREYDHITLARVLIARYQTERIESLILEAKTFLDRLLHAAEIGERIGSILDILIAQALAYYTQNNLPAALMPFERALTLAAPDGYVQSFADEGMPVMDLLRASIAHKIVPGYATKLLAMLDSDQLDQSAPSGQPQHTGKSSSPSLTDSLSERELDVLRLLRTELSGPEIADELGVALSTIRTHTKSIYSKLQVSNRRAAVNRAESLDLI